MTLTSKPNYEPHFIKYATTLYSEVPKPIQEAEKYCAVVPKLKGICLTKHKHAHYQIEKKKKKKTKKREKNGPESDMWEEKRIVTLMSNLDFDFINCVCLPSRLLEEELIFFVYLN